MKILVIGASGQLAMALREVALQQLKGLDDLDVISCGRPELDLANADSLERVMSDVQPDLVINAAAYTAVDAAEEEGWPEALVLNRDGVERLGKATSAREIPIIHVSTDYVYDGRKKTPYVETDPTDPINAYGRSKLMGEQTLAAANPRHIILRTAWVFSPTGTNFLKTMLRLGSERSELGIVADQFGNPSYAPHLARAILQIAHQIDQSAKDNRGRFWGIYHMVGTGEASWHQFAKEIFKASKKAGGSDCVVEPISTKDFPTKAARPANSRLDCAKLEKVFNITMPPWRTGVDECLDRLL
ncbi:MAG: dTDP-4-dehydrorhamnose reductase [Hyphomicrobiaceae bacterium]|nr:dTDP-4-dehydrorhamnose reductase [Hyphomicrobiaceae bacterium]